MFGAADFARLEGLRRAHYPPERNKVPAHLTLFHQLPPSAEAELASRLAAVTRLAPPHARLAGIIDLGEGTALRVESEALKAMRNELADALFGLLGAQDLAPWQPHVTIQNKVSSRDARTLQAGLRASFEPRPLQLKGLAAWHYLGGPWQPIRNYAFRG